jgi:hypothetical protein
VWRIEHGCALSLINTYTPPYGVFSMAVSPSGNALVLSYGVDFVVGSYGIGPGGVLTGPYTAYLNGYGYASWGVDITADSKYAIFDTQFNDTTVDIFVINSNGSLGNDYEFGGYGDLGDAPGAGWIRLSPDQKFLFVNDDSDKVTTLNFTEAPINLTYTGCMTTLRVPKGERLFASTGMATELPSGGGGALYVTELLDVSGIAILTINAETGCTREASASPFALSDPNSGISTLVPWPPRPF